MVVGDLDLERVRVLSKVNFLLLTLTSLSVHCQHYEDSSAFSAFWVMLLFP